MRSRVERSRARSAYYLYIYLRKNAFYSLLYCTRLTTRCARRMNECRLRCIGDWHNKSDRVNFKGTEPPVEESFTDPERVLISLISPVVSFTLPCLVTNSSFRDSKTQLPIWQHVEKQHKTDLYTYEIYAVSRYIFRVTCFFRSLLPIDRMFSRQ